MWNRLKLNRRQVLHVLVLTKFCSKLSPLEAEKYFREFQAKETFIILAGRVRLASTPEENYANVLDGIKQFTRVLKSSCSGKFIEFMS